MPQRAPTPGPPDHAPPRQTTKGGWEGQKFCLDTSQLNLGILLDVYFHCRKQWHEEEVDPVELEMYQAQTDQSVQRPLRVPNGRSPRRRRGSGVAGRGVSPSGVAAAGRARVEHDRPRARPGLAAVRRRPVLLVLVQRLVVSERGNPHARRWRVSFLSFTVFGSVVAAAAAPLG